MKVLSLFDGISCGRVALERAGIPVETYYSSEIDKYAIKVTQKNYPETIQIGDVCNVNPDDYKDIDLLIGGSPCQSLSILMAQNRKNLNGKSKLFFEYLRILKAVKPKYFLLENLATNSCSTSMCSTGFLVLILAASIFGIFIIITHFLTCLL